MKIRRRSGFTLIELLIVVAIIGILAAIAVPNFLEAQVRAKVARVRADVRSLATAMEVYVMDFGNEPAVDFPFPPSPPFYSVWWGFVPHLLTTPVAYISSLPSHPFTDRYVLGFWTLLGGTQSDQTYTWIRDTNYIFRTGAYPPGAPSPYTPISAWASICTDPEFVEKAKHSDYIIYSCGPDGADSTVWYVAVTYDASNGTVSFGEIYYYGGGNAFDDNIYD